MRLTVCRNGWPGFRKGGAAQGGGKNAGIPGAGVGKVRFEEEVQGGGVNSAGLGGWGAVASWSCSLAEGSGSWCSEGVGSGAGAGEGVTGYGVGGGYCTRNQPLQFLPLPPMQRWWPRLHELYDSEKKVSKKVEEAKGRLETARAKVMEAEEGMARVDGELQGIQEQIKALLREEEERKERRWKEEEAGGDDMQACVLQMEGQVLSGR